MRTHDEMEMMKTVPLIFREVLSVAVQMHRPHHVVAILPKDILKVVIDGSLHCVYHHPLNVVLSLTKQKKK